MNIRMSEPSIHHLWPGFTDVAISILLILIFFIFIQFIANSKAIVKILLEKDQKKMYHAFESRFKTELDKGEITIVLDGNLQRLQFSDKVLFDSGSDVLKESGKRILLRAGRIFKDMSHLYKRIQVEGHTDNVPIVPPLTRVFPTNWELSSGRAISVVKFLQEEVGLTPTLLSANGFSEYQPIVPNDTEENKARNRRIEIVLVYSEKQLTKKTTKNVKPIAKLYINARPWAEVFVNGEAKGIAPLTLSNVSPNAVIKLKYKNQEQTFKVEELNGNYLSFDFLNLNHENQ